MVVAGLCAKAIRDTHPDLLPRHLVEEDVAPLLLLQAHLYGLGEGDVFGEPHFEFGVESPVAIRPFGTLGQ